LCEDSFLAQIISVPHAGILKYEEDKHKVEYIKYSTPAGDNALEVS